MKYAVVIEKAPKNYSAYVPDVPGCIATGLTVAETKRLLAEAIEIRQSLSIVYDGGTKGRRRRQITPRSLIESRGSLYLIAHCHIDDMEKHFRLDRILEIEGT